MNSTAMLPKEILEKVAIYADSITLASLIRSEHAVNIVRKARFDAKVNLLSRLLKRREESAALCFFRVVYRRYTNFATESLIGPTGSSAAQLSLNF